MKTSLIAIAAVLAACGSYPEPKQAQSESEAALRAAAEVGAELDPQANLHLKYARDQIAEAKKLIADGDYQKAELALGRARADAELAIAMTKARTARADADKARVEVTQAQKQLGK